MKKAINLAETIVLLLGVCLLLGYYALPIAGIHPYVVLTSSMEPVCPPGSLVLVSETDISRLQPGEIITFQAEEGIVTHRIEEITDEGFITKGDANTAPDLIPVQEENIIGSPVLIAPHLGNVIDKFFGAGGLVFIIGLVFLFLFLELLVRYRDSMNKENSPLLQEKGS